MDNDYEKPAVTTTLTEEQVFGGEDLMTSNWLNAWVRGWSVAMME